LGAAGLQFAVAHFAVSSNSDASKLPQPELVPAVECRPRNGLRNVFQKLAAGEQVSVAYLGGSITAQEGWRVKTQRWLKEKYPAAKLTEINAAIGGTGADLGAFRLRHDVLQFKPDLLFVEFAVNDAGAEPRSEYARVEGIVRQTWRDNPLTDICFVYTLAGDMLDTLKTGQFPRAASAMEKVAEYYAIPSIHFGVEVARLEAAGELVFKGPKPTTAAEQAQLGDRILFSPDAVHPYTDTGHQLYFEALVRSFDRIQSFGAQGPHSLGPPLVSNNWERASIIPLERATRSSGWQKLDLSTNRLAQMFVMRLPQLYAAHAAGESLSFRFRGTGARVYDLLGPDCGQLSVALDDKPAQKVARFDSFCTYHRLGTLGIGEDLPDTVHTVKITILPDQPDKAAILEKGGNKMDDPKRFDGSVWYAGALLILGELVE